MGGVDGAQLGYPGWFERVFHKQYGTVRRESIAVEPAYRFVKCNKLDSVNGIPYLVEPSPR